MLLLLPVERAKRDKVFGVMRTHFIQFISKSMHLTPGARVMLTRMQVDRCMLPVDALARSI